MDCPFCSERVQKSVFDESERFLAIYNVAPIFPGHSLIIPKNHIETILDMEESWLSEMMIFARKVTEMLMHSFSAEAFNWSLQEKEFAGQTLQHIHLHIVLRYPNDLPDPGDWYPHVQKNYSQILDSYSRDKIDEKDMQEIIHHLRKCSNFNSKL